MEKLEKQIRTPEEKANGEIRNWFMVIIFSIILLYAWLVLAPAFLDTPKDQVVNLSEFGGRIYQGEVIQPGTFSIQVPFTEALKWGKEAILRYSNHHGVEIWRPDTTTTGVFQYAQKYAQNYDEMSYQTSKIFPDLDNRKLKIKYNLRVGIFIMVNLFFVTLMFVAIYVTITSIRQKYYL